MQTWVRESARLCMCVCVVFICPPVNVAVWMKVHELMSECSRLFLLPEQHSGFIICKSSVNCVKSGLLDVMRGSASGLCNNGCCRSCDDSNKDINSLLSSIISTKNNSLEGRAIKWRKWEKSARDYAFCKRLCWYQEDILHALSAAVSPHGQMNFDPLTRCATCAATSLHFLFLEIMIHIDFLPIKTFR